MGTGSEWLSIWTNGDNLKKYAWNLVTATFDSDAGEMCLYLNGELVASGSVPKGAEIAAAKRAPLLVGRNGEAERLTAGYLNVASGYIDEVKLYGEAIPEKDIAEYYKSVTVPEIAFDQIWLQNILTGVLHPAPVPRRALPVLDERAPRPSLLQRHLPPVLSGQHDRRLLAQHLLGASGQP